MSVITLYILFNLNFYLTELQNIMRLIISKDEFGLNIEWDN